MLTWPAAALIFGLIFILAFKRQLASLLDRTEKVKDWLSAPKQPTAVAAPAEPAVDSQTEVEALTAGFQNQLVLEQEARILDDLKKHGLTAQTPTEKVLLKHLAGAQIILHFEKVHSEIYGSQVRLLRWLSGQTRGVAVDALKPFYDQGAASAPATYKSLSLFDWAGFLVFKGLMEESKASAAAGSEADPFDIRITTVGREYLKYLVDAGKADPWFG